MSDEEQPEQMYCHRCQWQGPWSGVDFAKCADGCCDIYVCPKCGLELSNYPLNNNEPAEPVYIWSEPEHCDCEAGNHDTEEIRQDQPNNS